jgi:uncharacterized iron-regulated membrane protein
VNSTFKRFHRVFGLLLALPLFLWMITGILFNVKYRYAEAYEALKVPVKTKDLDWREAKVSPADLVERGLVDGSVKLSLFAHPSNRPAYAGSKAKAPVVIDAGAAAQIPAASEAEARAWAQAAVDGSPNASRYGSATSCRETTRFSSITGVSNPAFALEYSGGKTITIDRLTGEISQTGQLNDWIDFTYKVHYLQWTPWKPLNIGLVLIAAPLAFALAFSGIRMFFGKG